MSNTTTVNDYPVAGLFRRLAALIYDALLILALMMVVGAFATALNGGDAIESDHPAHPFFVLVLALVWLSFYVAFWLKAGQTLGMKCWRMIVVPTEEEELTLRLSLLRSFCGGLSLLCLGLGYLWAFIDKNGHTAHDRLSKTKVLVTPKK